MRVETVSGSIEGEALGLTLVHEHFRLWREAAYVQFPHLYDEEAALEAVVAEVEKARRLGVVSLCDATVLGLGRDIRFIKAVAARSGLQVIAATGAYTFDELPPVFEGKSVDLISDAFVHDLEVGIQGTDIRAGFLKCATDTQGVTPGVELILRAVARAHLRTGAPIMTHSHPATRNGLIQQDIFEDEGVNLAKVLIGHCGDTEDIHYLREIGERGSFMGMDRYGLSDILATEQRNKTVLKLCELGFAEQLMLSQDYAPVRDREESPQLKALRSDWSFTYVLDSVVPALRGAGLPAEAVNLMLIDNVRRWLVG